MAPPALFVDFLPRPGSAGLLVQLPEDAGDALRVAFASLNDLLHGYACDVHILLGKIGEESLAQASYAGLADAEGQELAGGEQGEAAGQQDASSPCCRM